VFFRKLNKRDVYIEGQKEEKHSYQSPKANLLISVFKSFPFTNMCCKKLK
jgi:hypothetical protein